MNAVSQQVIDTYYDEALQHSVFVDAEAFRDPSELGDCDLYLSFFAWSELTPHQRVFLRDNILLQCKAGLIVDTHDKLLQERDQEVNALLGIGLGDIHKLLSTSGKMAHLQSEVERYGMRTYGRDNNLVLIWGNTSGLDQDPDWPN